jgi:hypothetical protein
MRLTTYLHWAQLVRVLGTLLRLVRFTAVRVFLVMQLATCCFANTSTSLDRIPVGTNGYILTSNGTAPAWAVNTAATADDAYFLSFMMG